MCEYILGGAGRVTNTKTGAASGAEAGRRPQTGAQKNTVKPENGLFPKAQ